MRSIFAKVLLWSLGTFVLSMVAYWAIWRALWQRGPGDADPFPRISAMVEDDVCRAYEEGGPNRLRPHFAKLDSYPPANHRLPAAKVRDRFPAPIAQRSCSAS